MKGVKTMKSTQEYCNMLDKIVISSLVLVTVISGAALAGWLFDSIIIASIHKSFIPMAPSSALFFIILSGALLIHRRFPDSPAARIMATAAALFVAVTSVAILADYYLGAIELNIEGLIPFSTGMLDAVPTGRMSPISAASFSLAGLTVSSLTGPFQESGFFKQASALLATAIVIVGWVVLLGYLHGSPLLYGGAIIPVALPTAIAFIALGMGLCASSGPDLFPQRLFLGDSISSRLMRAFLPATVAIVQIQGILSARYYSKATNPSLISSLITLFSATVLGFLIIALSRVISNKMEAGEAERMLAERELSESEGRFRAFFENSIDAMFLSSPNGVIYSANPEACRIFEMTEQDILSVGKGLIERDMLLREALAERLRTGKYRGELTGIRSNGTRFPIEISASVFKTADGQDRICSTVRDITEQKRAREELRKTNALLKSLSNTDPLTQLSNRRHLMATLDKEMKRAKRSNGPLTLLLFDVDHFKIVNDSFGHQSGDAVLMAIAKVAREMLRCNDIAARYGGEEFVLLLTETYLPGGVVVAERLREAVQAISFAAPMENLSVTVSVGIATFPSASVDDIDSLFHQADEALYRAKKGGRNRVEMMTSRLQLAS
jgi:diguanylate cyclase (GGDEF)-like protein/PAS domain S-box-containing protein